MAKQQGKLAFRLGRLWGFLKLLMKNKKSAAGLAIALFFVAIALGAPLLTPYNEIGEDPTMPWFPLSDATSAPTWLRGLPKWLGGNPLLSENIRVAQNPGLPQLKENGGEWYFLAEGSGKDAVSTYINNEGFPGKGPPGFLQFNENGSLAIKFSRTETGVSYNGTKINLSIEFDYPYQGPPGRFFGNLGLMVDGSTHEVTELAMVEGGTFEYIPVDYLDAPIVINVYLGQVDGKKWKVWPSPQLTSEGIFSPYGFARDPTTNQPWGIDKPRSGILVSGGWIISRSSAESRGSQIDSESIYLVNKLTEFGVQSFPHKVVFSKPGKYVFGIEIVFLDQDANQPVETTVSIDNFGLVLYGTSYGLLGTDHHGRDLFSQLIYGSRISLYIGLTVAAFAVSVGLSVGLAAGYSGKVVDELLMRLADVLLVLPGLPLLIVLMAVLGASLENLILLLGLLGWMGFARLVRSQVLSIKERPFVEAAKAVGAGRFHIIISHILPSVMSLVYISLATAVPGAVTAEAALAWLGFYDPSRMSWGRMLNGVFEANAMRNWWWVLPPGLFISLLAVAFILLGYALDEVLNPRLRLRR